MISRTAAPRLSSRSRRLALAGLTLTAALSLSACELASPVTTDMPYEPADGVSVDAGDIAVRDLLVISEGDGAAGVVSGLVVNNSPAEAQVSLVLNAEGQMTPLEPSVTLAPGTSTRLDGMGHDGSGQAVSVPAVAVAAGGTMEIVVQTDGGKADSALVPVVLPEGYYSDHVVATSDGGN